MANNNEHEVMINKVELASNLAHRDLYSWHGDKVYKNKNAKTLKYTEAYQIMFDDLYDSYCEEIKSCEINET